MPHLKTAGSYPHLKGAIFEGELNNSSLYLSLYCALGPEENTVSDTAWEESGSHTLADWSARLKPESAT